MNPQAHIDPFSNVALQYDEDFTALPEVMTMRARVQSIVLGNVPRGARILDVACGTGEDAYFFSKIGYRVVGLDASPVMLERAKKKCATTSASFVQLRAESLTAIRDETFDVIFSNFGGLNCIEQIGGVFRDFARIARPGALAVICLLNPTCLWETLAFAARGKFLLAARRWKKRGVYVPVGPGKSLVWYHSSARVREEVAPYFEVRQVVGLNIITPPPSSREFIARHPRLHRNLVSTERHLCNIPPFRSWGDHIVFVLKKKS